MEPNDTSSLLEVYTRMGRKVRSATIAKRKRVFRLMSSESRAPRFPMVYGSTLRRIPAPRNDREGLNSCMDYSCRIQFLLMNRSIRYFEAALKTYLFTFRPISDLNVGAFSKPFFPS